MLNRKSKVVLIVGRKGSGKSTLARLILSRVRFPRLIIFDPMIEYSGGVVVYSYAELYEYMNNLITEYSFNHSDLTKMPFRIICRFSDDDDYHKAIGMMLELRNLWVVIEEVTHFVTVHHKSVEFDRLIRYGRHYSINVIMITQRCSEIPRLYTSQADTVISFHQHEPRDLDYMSRIGTVGSDGAEDIACLPRFEYPKNKNKLIESLNESSIVFSS